MKSINVLILETKKLYRESLEFSLSSEKDFRIVKTDIFNFEDKFYNFIQDIDILVLFVSQPFSNYLNILNQITENCRKTKTIIIGNLIDKDIIHDSLNYGAKSYLTKETSIEELKKIIREVSNTGFYIPAEISRFLGEFVTQETRRISVDNLSSISIVESSFLQLICKEYNNKEIAFNLNISNRTVENIKNRLLKKTGTKSTVGLCLYAIKNGIYSME
jgi:DNA-binding NarL/FixJ family response regulator